MVGWLFDCIINIFEGVHGIKTQKTKLVRLCSLNSPRPEYENPGQCCDENVAFSYNYWACDVSQAP